MGWRQTVLILPLTPSEPGIICQPFRNRSGGRGWPWRRLGDSSWRPRKPVIARWGSAQPAVGIADREARPLEAGIWAMGPLEMLTPTPRVDGDIWAVVGAERSMSVRWLPSSKVRQGWGAKATGCLYLCQSP